MEVWILSMQAEGVGTSLKAICFFCVSAVMPLWLIVRISPNRENRFLKARYVTVVSKDLRHSARRHSFCGCSAVRGSYECLGTSFVECVFISVCAFGDEVVLQGNLRKRGGRIVRWSRGMRTEKTGLNKIDALHLVPAAPPLLMGDFPHAPAQRNRINLSCVDQSDSVSPAFRAICGISDGEMRKDR